MKAKECEVISKYIKKYPPIVVPREGHEIGNPVWCGNNACEEYQRKKDEEHERHRENTANRV